MSDHTGKRKKVKYRIRYGPPAAPWRKMTSKHDFELSPEDERIIKAVELRHLRELGYLP